MHGADIAAAFQHPQYDSLTGAALRPALAVLGVLVFLLTANERLVGLYVAAQGLVEGACLRGVPKPLEHKPSRFLRDPEVFGQGCAGDPLLVGRDQVNRNKPFLQGEFGVLENCPDADRKPLPAVAALVRAPILKVVDPCRAAVRAESPASPADRGYVVRCRLARR